MKEQSGNNTEIDKDLVRRVQQGDKSAFDLLVIKYQHRIIQLVNRYVKDPSEAQDVAQEAFIKAYRALGKFRGDSAFYTWLYRIAINTAKNYLVSRSRRYSDYQIDIQDAEQVGNAPQLKGMDTPEHLLMNDEIVTAIKSAIEKLPDEMKNAIMLREFEGMSYEEIAQTMECPVGTVRSRIFRAREAIDKKLDPLLN
ncbi:MAG: RNA polymerase sigma factor RpoE [Methylococcales symbiont of Iophon sp. n. MRB-2018]|nr:MAG: RNA polymerase sigma factor RpoE [Methylococcales symbiont of Iophon sp. n. MRB-2018]KAF3979797.1 MAG: RNA polymerase sigma factor RpoE [Methylococcales symbiont of Iophon sp. n. MRB-2018]